MLLRCLLLFLPLLAVLAGCGGEDAAQPTEERTYYCGSYERAEPGAVFSEPPC